MPSSEWCNCKKMEQRIKIRKSAIILLIGCSLAASMCTEKPAGDPLNHKKVISAKVYWADNWVMTINYVYSNSLLTEINVTDLNDDGESKKVYQYNGGKIASRMFYIKSRGAWETISVTEVNGYVDDNPVEIIVHEYSGGVEQNQVRTRYTYEDGLPKMKDRDFTWNNTWIHSENTWFDYDSDGRIIRETDTVSPERHITDYSYDAGHMTEALTRRFGEGESERIAKSSYTYTNNRLTEITYLVYLNGTWMAMGSMHYQYYADGELWISEEFTGSCFGPEKIEYSYIDGFGNYPQIEKTENELPLPGDPTPCPSAAQTTYLTTPVPGRNQ